MAGTVTRIVVAPAMTWLFVSTCPSFVRTIPVPAALASWSARSVLTITTPFVGAGFFGVAAPAPCAWTTPATAIRATARERRITEAVKRPYLRST